MFYQNIRSSKKEEFLSNFSDILLFLKFIDEILIGMTFLTLPHPYWKQNHRMATSGLEKFRFPPFKSITVVVSQHTLLTRCLSCLFNLFILFSFAGTSGFDRRGQSVFGGERDSLPRDHGHCPSSGVHGGINRHHSGRRSRLRKQRHHGKKR